MTISLVGAPVYVRALAKESGVEILDWNGNELDGYCDYKRIRPPDHYSTDFETVFYYDAWTMDASPSKRGLLQIRTCATPEMVRYGAEAGVWLRQRMAAWNKLHGTDKSAVAA